MGTKTLPMISVLFAGFASIAHAQDGTFRTWFETPDTVMAGDTFEVHMWASFEGDLLQPEGYFSAALANFEVSGDLDTFEAISPLTFGLTFIFDEGTPDGPWLRDVFTAQHPALPDVDYSNPILVLGFEVTTLANSIGMLDIDIRPGFDPDMPLLEWSVNGTGTSDDIVRTTDPNIALIATPASVRVVPTPASSLVLALAALGASRRRR